MGVDQDLSKKSSRSGYAENEEDNSLDPNFEEKDKKSAVSLKESQN